MAAAAAAAATAGEEWERARAQQQQRQQQQQLQVTSTKSGGSLTSQLSAPAATADPAAATAGSSSVNSLQPSQPPVMSVPCHMCGTLRNRDGVMLLYRDRIEFVATPEGLLLKKVRMELFAAI